MLSDWGLDMNTGMSPHAAVMCAMRRPQVVGCRAHTEEA